MPYTPKTMPRKKLPKGARSLGDVAKSRRGTTLGFRSHQGGVLTARGRARTNRIDQAVRTVTPDAAIEVTKRRGAQNKQLYREMTKKSKLPKGVQKIGQEAGSGGRELRLFRKAVSPRKTDMQRGSAEMIGRDMAAVGPESARKGPYKAEQMEMDQQESRGRKQTGVSKDVKVVKGTKKFVAAPKTVNLNRTAISQRVARKAREKGIPAVRASSLGQRAAGLGRKIGKASAIGLVIDAVRMSDEAAKAKKRNRFGGQSM